MADRKGSAPTPPTTTTTRRNGHTEAELIFAIAADERQLGRPHTPGERDAFARGFFGEEYAEEIRMLAAVGLLDAEDEEEE